MKLKRYFTKILTEMNSFEEARDYCKKVRREYMMKEEKEEKEDEFPKCARTEKERKVILLSPLMYRYFQEMVSPLSVMIKARALILSVLLNKKEDQMEEKAKEYLEAFEKFEREDRKEVQELLFSSLWEISMTSSFLTSTSSIHGHVQRFIQQYHFYVQRFGWQTEYEQYKKERKEKEQMRVYETMEKAFWDKMEQEIKEHDFSSVQPMMKEIFHLLKDIPHPKVVESEMYLEELLLLDILDMTNLLSLGETEARVKSKVIFEQIFRYIQEADSEAFEPLYDEIRQNLENTERTLAQFLVKGFQYIYTMIYQLRAKIQLYRIQD
jgi:hypothetical protein